MFTTSRIDTIILWLVLAIALVIAPAPIWGHDCENSSGVQKRLERGEVVVSTNDDGTTKYVTAQILINAPPDEVWPIMVNPFEFQGKISPRMKTVEVMADQANRSVLKVTLDVLLIPHFTYMVESLYDGGESIKFRRVGGILKDFRGSWVMAPAAGGDKTELTYCMYVDPGFPVPQWLIREAIKNELPRTLISLRERIQAVSEHPTIKEHRTILAALTSLPRRKLNNHSIWAESTAKDLQDISAQNK